MINLPESCKFILDKLTENGFIAYIAGGSVRDYLLKIEWHDHDIVTNAKPEEVEKIFPNSIPVGKKYGVIIVPVNGINYEIATFRNDLEYIDGRHPEGVVYSTPEEDAKRRDFTVNALFYDYKTNQIIDFVNGKEDLKNKTLRAIGNADKRFCEDALRLFRAIRFAVKFNLRIEKSTIEGIKNNYNLVSKLSGERVRDELNKIFTARGRDTAFRILDKYHLLDFWLPEISEMHGVEQKPEYHPEGDVFEHTAKILHVLEPPFNSDVACVWGAILHDVGKPDAFKKNNGENFILHDKISVEKSKKILERLKFSNQEKEEILAIVGEHQHFQDAPKMRVSTLKKFLAQEYIEKMLAVHKADCLSSTLNIDSYTFCVDSIEKFKGEESLAPPPLLTGNDLIKLGFYPGPSFRKILEHIRNLQLENKIKNKDEAIYEIINKKWNNN